MIKYVILFLAINVATINAGTSTLFKRMLLHHYYKQIKNQKIAQDKKKRELEESKPQENRKLQDEHH